MNERNLSLFFSVLLSVCLFSSHQDVCVTLSLHLPLLQARRRAPRRCSVNICGKHKVCVMLFLGSLLRLCLSAPLILSLPSILASRCLCIPPPPQGHLQYWNHPSSSQVQGALQVQKGVSGLQKEKLPHPCPPPKAISTLPAPWASVLRSTASVFSPSNPSFLDPVITVPFYSPNACLCPVPANRKPWN